MKTLTTSAYVGIRPGVFIKQTPAFRPWWTRLWRWITRQKDPVYRVIATTGTVVTIREE